MVVLGILTSLYGLYQLAFGFPSFEQYWIDNTEFYNSISVGNVKRALATYSSAEEWGRYIEIGGADRFWFWRYGGKQSSPRRLVCVRRGTDRDVDAYRPTHRDLWPDLRRVRPANAGSEEPGAARLVGCCWPWRRWCSSLYLVQAPTNDDMLSHGSTTRWEPCFHIQLEEPCDPAKEESLQERLKNWTFLFTELIPYRPLGIGIGGTSVGAWRFNA